MEIIYFSTLIEGGNHWHGGYYFSFARTKNRGEDTGMREVVFALHANSVRETTAKGWQHILRGAERIEWGWRLEDARSNDT